MHYYHFGISQVCPAPANVTRAEPKRAPVFWIVYVAVSSRRGNAQVTLGGNTRPLAALTIDEKLSEMPLAVGYLGNVRPP